MSIAAIAALAGVLELALLLACRNGVRGTTLTAAWGWAAAAAVGVAGTETAIGLAGITEESGAEALRFLAAALTFCPLMAVLGARRPQHRAWQFVVLSMWGVVALPALENYILRRGQAMEIHGVRSGFLAGLIALGVVNWLPTRYWLTALLLGAGQALLLAPHLPGLDGGSAGPRILAAAACFLGGTFFWIVANASRGKPVAEWDRLWRDFRNGYGALWALRVMERVNAAAAAGGWPLRLAWRGFQAPDGSPLDPEALPPRVQQALRTVLENLLRRFLALERIAKPGENDVH